MVRSEPLVICQRLADELSRGSMVESSLQGAELALRRFLERGERVVLHDALHTVLQKVQAAIDRAMEEGRVPSDRLPSLERLRRLVERSLQALAFARRLRAARQQARLSVEALTRLAGVHPSVGFRLERGGYAPPSRETLDRLARALGVSPADLLGTQGPSPERGSTMPEAVEALLIMEGLADPERALLRELMDWWQIRLRRGYLLLGPELPDDARSPLRLLAEALRRDGPHARRLRAATLEVVAGLAPERLGPVLAMLRERR